MFKQKNDNETDFCESYKSQVLGREEEKTEQSLFSTIVKLLTILILLATIIVISLYGYHYFVNDQKLKGSVVPPISLQVSDEDTISDEDLVVELEEPKIENIVQVPEIKEVEIEQVVQVPQIKEVEEPKIEKVIQVPEIKEVEVTSTIIDEAAMDEMANAIKIEIAKSEIKEEAALNEKNKSIENINSSINSSKEEINLSKSEESLEVPTASTSAPEAKYLEELADLSREIDKERNK